MWRNGGTASRGVELVAEIGNISDLQGELSSNGNVLDQVSAVGIDEAFDGAMSAPSLHLCVDEGHPYVSGIGMIAPSPDWFSGLYNLPLWNRDTQTWYKKVELNVFAWDAGTEEGKDFDTRNPGTMPLGIISAFQPGDIEDALFVSVGQAGLPFLQVKPVGVLKFELQESSERCS